VRIIDFENSSILAEDDNMDTLDLENEDVLSMLSTIKERVGCNGSS